MVTFKTLESILQCILMQHKHDKIDIEIEDISKIKYDNINVENCKHFKGVGITTYLDTLLRAI